jgi:DNA-binding transcriptional LysR family regulator
MILDLAALQTLVAAVDLDGFGKAAERLHRSPGAVSLQMKALEERLGTPLFRKSGRRQALTDAGEVLLGFARRLLQLHDEALLALRRIDLDGDVSFGMPQDFADSWLPLTLAQFARAHPAVRIDITVDRNAALLAQLERGKLDLVLAFGEAAGATSTPISRLPIHWLAHPHFKLPPEQPIPLLVLDAPCVFRQAATDALDKAKRPWRIVMKSASVSAVWAAAEAGLGVTARCAVHVPSALTMVGDTLKLPKLKKIALSLHQDHLRIKPAVDHLHALVEDVVKTRLNR